jgi:poly [ADP-ribose] polymerase
MPTLIKEVRLIKTEVESNNNKWWDAKLYDDGRVVCTWGRVGYSGDSGEWQGGMAYLEKKIKEKTKKGYTEQKTIGGNSTSGISPVKNGELHAIAKSQLIKVTNPTLSRLIDRLVSANVHTITSNTQITYNSSTGLFATPLGVVTIDGIVEARNILADIAPLVRGKTYGSQLNILVSKYLRIIPQNVGMKLNVEYLFPNETAIQKQNDLIDSLESSYQALQTTPPTNTNDNKTVEQVFKVDMDVLNDQKERSRIEDWFERSKKSQHHYDNVKIREIYIVNIYDMSDRFIKNDPNITEVFHGSSMANVLSILKSGLKINPPSTAAIAGKLFGNGAYGAINSSKSLGYSLNRWGQGGVGDAAFLFICSFAMGKIYETKAYGCHRPSNYDSIWAKASAGGLHNDELIVYSENRIKINYLLECK